MDLSGMVHKMIATGDLEALIVRALVASKTSETNAGSVAKALTQAETDGQAGHGLSRVASYAAQARSGKVDGFAEPTVTKTRVGSLVIDAANGFAYPAFDLAVAQLPAVVAKSGIAAAGLKRSHHAGVIGYHVERLAAQGLVALAFSNTPHAMAATGGTVPVFGTNPIGFAAPQTNAPPIVVDMALSHVARGKIMAAAQKGEAIPEGWAIDSDGRPTTDARAALQGTLLPMGGAKGSALAFMVEVLAAALMGAHLSAEATSFLDAEGAPPNVGQIIIAIDPQAFSSGAEFADRMSALVKIIDTDRGARLPGSRRLAKRAAANEHGIAVSPEMLTQLEQLAAYKQLMD
jgi:(2R)-3-sulfolactate dehydrogenase (NADP+)